MAPICALFNAPLKASLAEPGLPSNQFCSHNSEEIDGSVLTSEETNDDMLNEIACAFGLHPDALELVEHDEEMNGTEFCKSCKNLACEYAALQEELAESRKDTERYRNEIEDLHLTSSISRVNKSEVRSSKKL